MIDQIPDWFLSAMHTLADVHAWKLRPSTATSNGSVRNFWDLLKDKPQAHIQAGMLRHTQTRQMKPTVASIRECIYECYPMTEEELAKRQNEALRLWCEQWLRPDDSEYWVRAGLEPKELIHALQYAHSHGWKDLVRDSERWPTCAAHNRRMEHGIAHKFKVEDWIKDNDKLTREASKPTHIGETLTEMGFTV